MTLRFRVNSQSGDARKPHRAEQREEIVRVARRWRVEVERELRRDPAGRRRTTSAREAFHRSGDEVPLLVADQSIVDTSMSASVILMLFTDDGRPPRDRLLIVPDVEMIVPRFVCSM